jgi:sulfate adenylyltransferase subunit 2
MIAFRDRVAAEGQRRAAVHINPDGVRDGIGPVTHGATVHTDVMKTQALKQALDAGKYDCAIGGARRDEEKSRAKERVFSFRNAQHRWDPKNQRPELWNLYNTRIHAGESVRVFPMSNWTELDVWLYIFREQIEVVPLYFAKPRPVVERDGGLIMVDDERYPLLPARACRQRWCASARWAATRSPAASSPTPTRWKRSSARCWWRAPSERQGRPDRRGPVRVDGKEEAGRLFLMGDAPDIAGYLAQHESKPRLRFITCGSVGRRQEHADRPAAVREQESF